MTLHCGKGMNEMERAICGMIHTSGFMSVSLVPFPFSLSTPFHPSSVRPSIPHSTLGPQLRRHSASGFAPQPPRPRSSAPLTRRPVSRSPGLTKSIEAEIARSVVADDVVCLCYVTMRMIPLQQRRKSWPLEAGQSMIT